MKTGKLFWAICLLILLIGTAGCAKTESQGDKKRLQQKLKDWRRAEVKVYDILRRAEEKDFNAFKNEFGDAFRELNDIHTEFGELVQETEDRKLQKSAGICEREMSKLEEDAGLIYSYYKDYSEFKEPRNIDRHEVNPDSARKQYLHQKTLYERHRSEGREKILGSGL